MAIFVISVSSDSSEESIGTSTGRVILFGTIPTTIHDTTPFMIPPSTHIDTALTPTSPDYTPTSPDYSPASDTESDLSEDPSSDHIPPLPAILPFLSLTGDSLDNDTPDTPPSPTMKRVGPLPRHSVDYSSSDHFALDDSSSSSSSSSSKTSSDPSLNDLFNSSSDHSLPAPSSGMRPSHRLCSLVPSIPHSSVAISDRLSHDSSFASPSRKRSRSPAASVPLSSPIPGALSYVHADLLPPPKRIRSPKSAIDLEAEIDECIAYADALRFRGIDARVIVEDVDREEIKTGARGPEEGAVKVTYETLGDLVQRFHDHTEEIPVHRVQAIESVQRDQGHIIVATGQQSADMLERIRELERDNMRLRDMMDVASQRVTRSQRRELRVQREMRQIWRFRFYDRMRIARLEACARRHLGYRQCLTPDLEHQGHVKELTNKLIADLQEHWELAAPPKTLNPL
ncbi:hypothetical protein Tco_1406125 [Tanacetum coccineum]